MPPSTSVHCSWVILPARRSSQSFQASEPDPRILPFQLPRSMGPAGTYTQGRPALMAPMMRPGVVLSQPPMSTAPSTGWLRSSSSVSMARKLRYSMVVGFTKDSDTEMAGSSTGKPPAWNTPRFTSSTRCLKWL
ncbi:hypothetical protein D3C71_857240 [compost metagenome]